MEPPGLWGKQIGLLFCSPVSKFQMIIKNNYYFFKIEKHILKQISYVFLTN